MNSLIILPSECVGQTTATLSGDRAAYGYQTHELRTGQTVKVAVLGGLRGTALVTNASPSLITLETVLAEAPLVRKPIDLIVGLSRPQTVKKVIQAAVMLGVRSLHFVLSATGEKSYRSSHALQDEHVQFETIKALEQIWDSIAPTVSIHYSLKRLFESELCASPQNVGAIRLMADPSGGPLSAHSALRTADAPLLVAIGPERGWTDDELHQFAAKNFVAVGLGPRVLRVELALVFMLGQLEVLYGAGLSHRGGGL